MSSINQNLALPITTEANHVIPWWNSLIFQAIIGLFIVILAIVIEVLAVIEIQGKRLVINESERLIEQMGNNVVSGLLTRIYEINALAKAESAIAERLPRTVKSFMDIMPGVIDFSEDIKIAGGGIWPEPYRFDPQVERRSFFWGRNQANTLQYYDDYNQSGSGYHHEEWYVPARHLPSGKCYWSQSYMDPYSYQPMVTCTVATNDNTGFSGAVTIDLRLDGLQAITEEWQRKTGGYVFIVDRNNRFITFPKPELAKEIGVDSNGKRTEKFILATELATREIRFTPLVQIMQKMNEDLINKTKLALHDKFEPMVTTIETGSYQVDAPQAQLIVTAIADPLAQSHTIKGSTLYSKIEIADDPLLNKPVTGYLFHIPDTYWKLVVIKPLDETTAVAIALSQSLLIYLLIAILPIIILAYLAFNRYFIIPLTDAASIMRLIGNLIAQRRYLELKHHPIKVTSHNEIGQLSTAINVLVDRVVENEGILAQVNIMLEREVKSRTADLSRTLHQLKTSQIQLVQSEKMAMLGQMVAGLAHEINTPLGYVKNNLLMTRDALDQFNNLVLAGQRLEQVIKDKDVTEDQMQTALNEVSTLAQDLIEQQLTDNVCQLAEDSLFGVTQISELVISLRNFARLDQAHVKAVNIHECIDSALKIAHNKMKDRVEIYKHYGKLPTIECSPARINQVILHLLHNATDAISEHGIITLTTTADDRYIHLSIKDNGKGIAAEHLDKIFEPFFTTKGAGEGTGLGLAICSQIIEQHQGFIKIDSTIEVGTCVQLSLPIHHITTQLTIEDKQS